MVDNPPSIPSPKLFSEDVSVSGGRANIFQGSYFFPNHLRKMRMDDFDVCYMVLFSKHEMPVFTGNYPVSIR